MSYPKVVLLGTHGYGSNILTVPETDRGCEVVGVVDDYRCKTEAAFYGAPLISSARFIALAGQHADLLAINTCENPKPRQYFEGLCKQNGITCISYDDAVKRFSLSGKMDESWFLKRKSPFKRRIFALADALIARFPRLLPRGKGVAIVRVDHIGDFVVWLQAAKQLRQFYGDRKITFFCNAALADYVRTLPYWDEVVPVGMRKFGEHFFYRCKMLLRMRLGGYATALCPNYSRALMLGDSLVRASRAPERIGWDGDLFSLSQTEKNRADQWYTRLLKSSARSMSEIARNMEFAQQVTGGRQALEIETLPRNPAAAVAVGGQYLVMFPGASWAGRRWPTSAFAELGNRLIRQYGWKVALCGAEAEKDLCEEIARGIGGEVINLAGATSLAQLIELIRDAQVVVTNETSAVHIAAAVRTKSVCIVGGGHWDRFVPYPDEIPEPKPILAMEKLACYGCDWKCSQPRTADGPALCVSSIPVDRVFGLVGSAVGA